MFCTACAAPNPVETARCVRCGRAMARVGTACDGAAGVRVGRRRGIGTGVRSVRPQRHPLLRLILHGVPLLALLLGAVVAGGRYRADRAALAADYARAEAAVAAGRYDEAISAFAAAGGYRDADRRRAAAIAHIAPYRAAYLDGVAALEAGRYDAALAALAPVVRDLPAYEDAAALLADARARREDDLRRRAEAAIAARDWLIAERALAALAAVRPADRDLAAQLAALRREHAPLLHSHEGRLLLTGPDGQDERLLVDDVPASWPSWSPDRTRVAFVSADRTDPARTAQLYVVNVDGSGLRLLADRLAGGVWPAWSPDGTQIAFTSRTIDAGPAGGGFAIHVVEVASGRETDLTGARFAHAEMPSWSPTGDRLAFVNQTGSPGPGDGSPHEVAEVWVLALATGELTNVGQERLPNTGYVAWSPAEDRLLVWGHMRGTWYQNDRTMIHLLDLTTGELTPVSAGAQETTTGPDQPVWWPVWAPDGSRFAYVEGEQTIRVRRSQGRGEVWVNVHPILSGFLSWSPDGQVLLAAAWDASKPSVLVPLADGPGTQVEVPLAFDFAHSRFGFGPPQWSPAHVPGIAAPDGTLVAPSVDGTARDPGGGPVAGAPEPGSAGLWRDEDGATGT